MPISRTPLAGGMNNLANPENLKNDEVQDSVNYELLGNNNRHKRKDAVEFGLSTGDDLNEVLTTGVSPIFVQLGQISPPMYPIRKLSNMTGDFVMLAIGLATAGVRLYMFYETATTWATELIEIDGIEYDTDSYLEFFIGDDKIIITDTYASANNLPHYVKIDADGELITGLFSIKSPTNKATLEAVTEYDSGEFEEDVTDVHLDDCGIVQCVYTVVTKGGDESNPSPISNSRMMQFFKKDLTDKNDIRWIDSFQITNLSVPELTGDLIEELKYFYVYFRVIRYSEGEAAEPFYFSQRFEIVDKENNIGTTGNGYLVSVPQDESILISYENDIAPIARHSAETAGIVGFANIKEKIRFPFDFEKYCTILINNINNKNFVDAIVQVRIYDKNNTGVLDANEVQVDFIAELDLSLYNLVDSLEMTDLNKIRIYDDDLTTPIQVLYDNYTGAPYIDVFVKIPLLTAGQIKTLYLCFNTATAADTDLGVITFEYQNFEYGQFTRKTATTMTAMLNTERVKSSKTIICSPMDFQDKATEIINMADDNNPGEIKGEYGSFSNAIFTKELTNQYSMGSGSYLLKGKDITGNDFSEIRYEVLPFGTIPDKVTMWGRIAYTNINTALSPGFVNEVPIPIFAFYQSAAHTGTSDYKGLFLSVYKTGEDTTTGEETYCFALYGAKDMTGLDGAWFSYYSYLIFDEIQIPNNAEGNLFISLSIDKENSASLFVGNLNSGSFNTQEVGWDKWNVDSHFDDIDDVLYYYTNIDTFSIGFNEMFNWWGFFTFRISQFQLIINKYYNGANNDDITAMWNLANFLPTFETPLGTKIEKVEGA